jgi:ketosteroid isomerase-like protein
MRRLALVALVCSLAGSVHAQSADPQITATINKFIDSFNKGDAAAAAATHASDADLSLVDEVPPFAWHGPTAFQSWAGDLEADAKKNGITDQKVTIKAPTRVETAGDSAYVVVPSVFEFKLKGVAMRETAQMTFVMKKGANGWLIHGWTWTGPKARKVAAAATK